MISLDLPSFFDMEPHIIRPALCESGCSDLRTFPILTQDFPFSCTRRMYDSSLKPHQSTISFLSRMRLACPIRLPICSNLNFGQKHSFLYMYPRYFSSFLTWFMLMIKSCSLNIFRKSFIVTTPFSCQHSRKILLNYALDHNLNGLLEAGGFGNSFAH